MNTSALKTYTGMSKNILSVCMGATFVITPLMRNDLSRDTMSSMKELPTMTVETVNSSVSTIHSGQGTLLSVDLPIRAV